MPPSTRAGQTGRDDDQATAGNGREEGWLTQVVRILQLANPALTAEEAIVRAMSLVNVGNQVPRGEAEKIPKDVSSSIAHIKKLSDSNWHTWEPTFIDCLQRVHNAKEILYGTVVPGSEAYDEDLDKALVGLIHACCNNSPDSRIDTYTVRGADEEVQLGSTLYAKLKKALTLNDAVKRAGLQDRIHTVRLHNRDVVKLGKELDSIWNDAARLGKRLDEDLKKSTLYHCTGQDWYYANSVDTLKTARPDCKYDEAYHALAKKQQDGEVSGRIRGAARVAASTEQWDTNQAGQGPRGRCDPRNPSAPPKCYASIDRGEQSACNTWIVDSGATHHMVNDERMLLTSTNKVGQISMAGDERLRVKAIGDASLWVSEATIQLLDVLYVPKLNANLLSVQGLIENGARVIFDKFGTTIKQNDGTQVQFRRDRRQGRFKVQGQALALELEETLDDVPKDNQNTGRLDNVPEDNQNTGNRDSNSMEDKDSYLWHERFGHPGRDKTRQIKEHYLGTDERMEHESKHCSTSEAPLELVHIDLMTDFKGHANYHYVLVAVDDFSSLIYVEPLCTKSAALTALRRWITRMERATDRKLKTLHSDNGGEWCSLEAEDWQTQEGFKWQKSVPGISIQNGRAERAIRSVQEKMHSMLIGRACPRELWSYAITAVSWAGMLGKQEGTSREHGRSAVSMETMDSYGFTCKGGAGPYARRGRQEEDQAQGACRWLPFRGSRDKSQRNHHRSKEEEQCIGDRQVGPEEEEQCRRSRHCSGGTGVPSKEEEQCRRRSSVEGVDTAQEDRSGARGPPVQYSTKRVLSGEREQEQCRWRRCEEVYNHALSSSEVEWIPIHSTHHIN
ncbi:uncharacterized protein UDID_18549 [Ustilago sp. UG-2017a]|nr:uncharacterized protein UDID_18549 [Ustilago sp. UG-2017a]